MLGLHDYLKQCGLDSTLINLVYLRASQINGCAFCLDMHAKDLRAAGESEDRIYLLDAWRESPVYTERERAALAWTEDLTRLGGDRVSDELYDKARNHFNEEELANLTLAVVAINGWNRLNIAFRAQPGRYRPAATS